jgi:hypothetical protein
LTTKKSVAVVKLYRHIKTLNGTFLYKNLKTELIKRETFSFRNFLCRKIYCYSYGTCGGTSEIYMGNAVHVY